MNTALYPISIPEMQHLETLIASFCTLGHIAKHQRWHSQQYGFDAMFPGSTTTAQRAVLNHLLRYERDRRPSYPEAFLGARAVGPGADVEEIGKLNGVQYVTGKQKGLVKAARAVEDYYHRNGIPVRDAYHWCLPNGPERAGYL
jgi:hypothetical protein